MTMTSLADQRNVIYFKRFKMEIELHDIPFVPALPEGYGWVAWEDSLLDAHAAMMVCSFQEEIDAVVFPSLGDHKGSNALMHEIRRKAGFLPQATWLLASGADLCGCVQGLRDSTGLGAIQNLGVAPGHRGRGLGSALLLQALHGFVRAGLKRAWLEVTARNDGAVRLYHRLGFRRRKTLYKAVEAISRSNIPISISGVPYLSANI
jgi:ribosomal protein S18 acetylase RimI-like enzyme